MTLPPLAPEPSKDVSADSLSFDRIEIRPAEYGVLVDQARVPVTVREFQVLWVLAQEPDVVLPRRRIYEQVWGTRMPYRDRSVDTFVRKLRIKLAKTAPDWVFIHTHFGIGYRFAPGPRVPEPREP